MPTLPDFETLARLVPSPSLALPPAILSARQHIPPNEFNDTLTRLVELSRAALDQTPRQAYALARIAELEASQAAWQSEHGATAATGSLPPPAPVVPTGLTANWERENERWSNPVQVVATSLRVQERELPAISVNVGPGSKQKGVVRRGNLRIDLRGQDSSQVVMTMSNPGSRPARVALALKTGANFEFFETPERLVAPGATEDLRFDLHARTFKCQASNWEHNREVAHLEDVRELMLMIYNGTEAAEVVIAGIDVTGPPASK